MTEMEQIVYEGPPEEWEKPFLEAFVNEFGIEGKAARAVGIHPNVIRNRVKNSPRFADMYDEAQRMVDDTLEYESVRRALTPSERPVYQRGQLVGVVQEWDTKHLEWLLERRIPERYHIPTLVEFGGKATDGAVKFKLALGDSEPKELESPGELSDED